MSNNDKKIKATIYKSYKIEMIFISGVNKTARAR